MFLSSISKNVLWKEGADLFSWGSRKPIFLGKWPRQSSKWFWSSGGRGSYFINLYPVCLSHGPRGELREGHISNIGSTSCDHVWWESLQLRSAGITNNTPAHIGRWLKMKRLWARCWAWKSIILAQKKPFNCLKLIILPCLILVSRICWLPAHADSSSRVEAMTRAINFHCPFEHHNAKSPLKCLTTL